MRRRGLLIAIAVLVVAAVVVGLVLGTSNKAESKSSASTMSPSPASTSTSTSTTTTVAPKPARLDDGSLGQQAPRIACTLLTSREIAAVFRAAVAVGVPIYPYCQWLVGSDTWVALQVDEGSSFNEATQYVATYQTIYGLGQEAIVANSHVLYFTEGNTTYALSVQTPSNFTPNYDWRQLVALGHDVLAKPLPTHRLGPSALPPAGPPIYFGGDSTAAGPEWAFSAYHETSPALHALEEYVVGSGLIRYNFFNWPRHLIAVAAARRPKLVIWMGSANDGQALIVKGQYAAVGSAPWVRAYAQIVGSTMKALVDEGCKVLWIGEPAMQIASLSASMSVIDSIYAREAARYRGVTFLNPGNTFNGRGGTYTGEVVIGRQETPVFLDGVHLNVTGSEYFANVIARYVKEILGIRPG